MSRETFERLSGEVRLELVCGMIGTAAQALVELHEFTGMTAVTSFNGITLRARKGTTATDICMDYNSACQKR